MVSFSSLPSPLNSCKLKHSHFFCKMEQSCQETPHRLSLDVKVERDQAYCRDSLARNFRPCRRLATRTNLAKKRTLPMRRMGPDQTSAPRVSDILPLGKPFKGLFSPFSHTYLFPLINLLQTQPAGGMEVGGAPTGSWCLRMDGLVSACSPASRLNSLPIGG